MPASVFDYPSHCEGECLIFDGSKSHGYGYAFVAGVPIRAHRAAWIEKNGVIPDGLTVDHICYRKDCINTDHLRLLSHSENTKLSRDNIARRAKTHCPQKHEYSGDNLYVDKRGSRYCRTCLKERDKISQQKQKEIRHQAMAIRKLKCRNKLHDMTPENTRILASGTKICIACSRATKIRWNNNHK